MHDFKERTQTPLGQQSKSFDLSRHRASLADTSLSAMNQRDQTLTSVQRIELQSQRNKVDSRRLVPMTRMYSGQRADLMDCDKKSIIKYSDEGNSSLTGRESAYHAVTGAFEARASSPHGQGDQAKRYDDDYANMNQRQLGITLFSRLKEAYIRGGNSSRSIRNGTDIRAYILNERKLDKQGYEAAYECIERENDKKMKNSLMTSINNSYLIKE